VEFDFDTPVDRRGTDSNKWGKYAGRDVLPLWVADMDFAAPDCVLAALRARLEHPILGYTVTPESTFAAIADWQWRRHGWRVEREWISVLPGLVPALALCVQAFSRPGEGVVVQPPVYNPLFEAVARNGRRLVTNPLLWTPAGHRMDFDQLEAALTPDTRLLLLCSPHNPGGRVWRRDELERLGAICLAHDLIVISDEIHADLVYPGAKHLPLAAITPELARRTVTLNSPGKTFNIAGLNCAYAICPDPGLRARLRAAAQSLHLEGANLLGPVALEAAYGQGEAWLAALLDYLRGNRDLARASLARRLPHVGCQAPEATFLLWLDCRACCQAQGLDDTRLRQRLIDAGLGLSPGSQFSAPSGAEGSGFMRLNFALPRAQLDVALERLGQALAAPAGSAG
jgi:cystathionine beta-lyase